MKPRKNLTAGGNRGQAHGGHALHGESVKPFRDRPVRSQAVVCPTCGAGVGEPCKTAGGRRTIHTSRRRMALRAENQMNEVQLP